jgi:hypothetical protein
MGWLDWTAGWLDWTVGLLDWTGSAGLDYGLVGVD